MTLKLTDKQQISIYKTARLLGIEPEELIKLILDDYIEYLTGSDPHAQNKKS